MSSHAEKIQQQLDAMDEDVEEVDRDDEAAIICDDCDGVIQPGERFHQLTENVSAGEPGQYSTWSNERLARLCMDCVSERGLQDVLDDVMPRVKADGGRVEDDPDATNYPDGFTSGDHHVLHDSHTPDTADWETRCSADGCTREAHNHRCGSCGWPLCGMHHELGGGFCNEFTRVGTRLGLLPCCLRVFSSGDVEIGTHERLVARREEFDGMEISDDDMKQAIREALPEWWAEKAQQALLKAIGELAGEYSKIAERLDQAGDELGSWLSGEGEVHIAAARYHVKAALYGVAYHGPDEPMTVVDHTLANVPEQIDNVARYPSGGDQTDA